MTGTQVRGVVRSTMDLVTWTHVVLDPAPSARGAVFWAAALVGEWRSAVPDPGCDASLVPRDGDAYVHRAGEGRTAPAVLLEVADVEAATRRALGHGAREEAGRLRSPGGLVLALLVARPRRRAPAARWPDGTTSRLVQLCLDCPPDGAQAEADFWAGLTGWARQGSDSPEFVGHLVPDTGSVQLLVQRRASGAPREVTVHLDLGTSDREAEARRLVDLGATRVGTGGGWVVLTDPDGRTFCATGQPPEAP